MGLKRRVPVAQIGEIPPGRTKTFRYGTANGIAFNKEGTVVAYVNRCTHMGGPVELKEKQGTPVFRCRWHEAEFNPTTGQAIEGEAPQGTKLTPIELTIEGDTIFAVLELADDPFSF
jgi:nitrite reductase/ring-hydroxylating ferredoxin subunit